MGTLIVYIKKIATTYKKLLFIWCRWTGWSTIWRDRNVKLKQKAENRIYYRKTLSSLNPPNAYASWDFALLLMDLIFLWAPKPKLNCYIYVLRSQNSHWYFIYLLKCYWYLISYTNQRVPYLSEYLETMISVSRISTKARAYP